MGLPAPPPMEENETNTNASAAASASRRPVPEWQKDPHRWIDYYNDGTVGRKKARVFCQLQNIQNRPELNGQVALCVGYHPSVQRYQVQLCRQSDKILSVAPDKVRKASPWQYATGKLLLLIHQQGQIHQDARAWLRRVVPVGILAGHRGPTNAELDDALGWLLLILLLVGFLAFALLIYVVGFNKASMLTAFGMTAAVVLGPELKVTTSPSTSSSSSSLVRRCGKRWQDFLQDMTGLRPSFTMAVVIGISWSAFVGWLCWAT